MIVKIKYKVKSNYRSYWPTTNNLPIISRNCPTMCWFAVDTIQTTNTTKL